MGYKKKIMGILDENHSYGRMMFQYLYANGNLPFEVVLFTRQEEIKEYISENVIEILLLDNEDIEPEIVERINQVILLTEMTETKNGRFPMIYRYQSMENIVKEVMDYYKQVNAPVMWGRSGGNEQFLGVYSPLHGCKKTAFALTYGQLLARNEHVLYLSLDAFSGFETLMNQTFQSDLSDMIFYQQQGSLMRHLTALIYKVGQLDYIPPVRCSEDLWNIDYKIFIEALHTLMQAGAYDAVLLDMGEAFGRVEVFMALCQKIYMPVREDWASHCRVEEFEQCMRMKGYEALLERVQKIKLPAWNLLESRQLYAEQLLWSELGDYVRSQIMMGEKWS